ncbi:MAG: hypothetical protein A2486_16165 [Burkholderiales bacterium RIFOXYC12_FULL_65_23]|uniref:TIGR04255 family protein n=1 Tax=Malikia spinosa TaxID=86180 RepID=UPI0008C7A10D|nr:MAG: hypothetical protein A2486_16165 [Burkholderiales bacterium RIFOXYC12_FULL_65_23]
MHPISTPSQQRNAIEAAVFALQLAQPIEPPALQRINAAFDALGDELPGQQLGHQGISFQFGAMQQPLPVPALHELIRFVARPNGAHLWRVQVQGATITVTCHDYTDFAAVWERAKRYLALVLTQLDAGFLCLELVHQVLDQFNYDLQPEDEPRYSLDELFRSDTPYLTAKAWRSGLLWHVYQGWFERPGDPFKYLNQVNISNLRMDDRTRYTTVIDHRIVASLDGGTAFGLDNPNLLDGVFRKLHDSNMTMLRELLTDQKQAEIGMRVAP